MVAVRPGALHRQLVELRLPGTGIQLMLIFYLCRNRPRLGAALYLLSVIFRP